MQVHRWRKLLTLRNSFFPSAHSALFHSTPVSLAMWKNKLNTVPGQGKYPSKVPGQGKYSSKQCIAVSTGMEGEEKLLQIDVYNKGTFRTEICNNWMKKGVCPYGNHCKFAHGLLELRPVIRHPRYKTEVCQMFLAGKTCPYGNRCHFRHSLTEQDRCEFAIGLQELRFTIRHPR